jgi:hypothetical protein
MLMGAIACFIIALQCMAYAVGARPQDVIGQDYLWLWWPIAIVWIYSGVSLVVWCFKK